MKHGKRIKLKELRGSYGTFDPETGQIEISSKLKKCNIPSKNFVYWHEKMHEWIHKSKTKISPFDEEKASDLLALFKCKNSELSYLESILKKTLIKKFGRSPSKLTIIKITKEI